MTPAAEFIRSLGIAATTFPEFPGMAFNFDGHPVRFGAVKAIGPKDIEVFLSNSDLAKPELVTVMGLICFLADVRGVNLILDFVAPSNVEFRDCVEQMLIVNGFASCSGSLDQQSPAWCRLAKSIAA